MKRYLMLAILSSSVLTASAQNYDDIYYRGNDAKKEAQKDAAANKSNNNNQNYNNEQYNNDYNAYNSNDYYENDSYIDYDDDSYTSRIRRFNYPMYNVGYWGGIYSPIWMNPYYGDPFYSWGGFGYRPFVRISFGYGPYWNSGWAYNTWMGYGSWGYPMYGGYGYGYPYGGFYGGYHSYGAGYWNGYYNGLHHNNYNRYNPARNITYGPRNTRLANQYSGERRVRDNGAITSPRANVNQNNNGGRSVQMGNTTNRRDINQSQQSTREVRSYNQNNIDNRTAPSQGRQMELGTPDRSIQSGSPNRSSSSQGRQMQLNSPRGNNGTPSRQMQMGTSRPSTPSRSYSAPSGGGSRMSSPSMSSPSRGGGGGSFGGGSRGGGGGSRR